MLPIAKSESEEQPESECKNGQDGKDMLVDDPRFLEYEDEYPKCHFYKLKQVLTGEVAEDEGKEGGGVDGEGREVGGDEGEGGRGKQQGEQIMEHEQSADHQESQAEHEASSDGYVVGPEAGQVEGGCHLDIDGCQLGHPPDHVCEVLGA